MMQYRKYVVPLLLIVSCVTTDAMAKELIGQETNYNREKDENDQQPVRQFIDSKDDVDLKKKASDLQISGDVRFEYQYINEDINGHPLRGGGHIASDFRPLSNNDFDVEFNLKFRYTYGKAWANAHFLFDNPAGINGDGGDCNADPYGCHGSGSDRIVKIKRAYIGYNVLADGGQRLDIELGRRKLNDIFDSEIQFDNRFDGLLIKYAKDLPGDSSWYVSGGVFLIDERVNYFGGAVETGILDIYDTGLDVKYSYIDWTKKRYNRCGFNHPAGMQSRNSQVTLVYHFEPTVLGVKKEAELYGAVLINHAARSGCVKHVAVNVSDSSTSSLGAPEVSSSLSSEIPSSAHIEFRDVHVGKENLGWYIGFYLGDVHKQGDWSFDINYQYVQAQAVLDCDVAGIGRGNIWDETFYGYNQLYNDPVVFERTLRGNANYHGVRTEVLYAITDNLSIDTVYQVSKAINNKLGGSHYYSNLEVEAIYAF